MEQNKDHFKEIAEIKNMMERSSRFLSLSGLSGLLASATLIFYGLALVNAGKYTLNEVQWLGISEIILGILAGIFLDFGLIFWAVGFGLLHIIY